MFKAAAGRDGFNIIYDTVGGDYSEPAVRSIAWEGKFLVVGFPAGIAKLPLNLTLLKSCDVCGVFWGAFAARTPQKPRQYFGIVRSLCRRQNQATYFGDVCAGRCRDRDCPAW